jgi:hypothetical protein
LYDKPPQPELTILEPAGSEIDIGVLPNRASKKTSANFPIEYNELTYSKGNAKSEG